MTVQQFLDKYNGQSLSYDGLEVNRGQCVQSVCFYCKENNLPVTWANASDWFTTKQHTEAFDYILNEVGNPNQVPTSGDIIIWNTSLPGSGGFGHIAVVLSASGGSFVSVDSNWGGKTTHAVTHNWSYVLGWMHPKTNQGGNMPSLTNSGDIVNLYNTELGRAPDDGGMANFVGKPWPDVWYGIVGSAEHASVVANRQAQVDALTNTINQLNQTVTDITSQSNATKADQTTALSQIASLTADLSTAHDQLKELQAKPPTIINDPALTAKVNTINTNVSFIRGIVNLIAKGLGFKK